MAVLAALREEQYGYSLRKRLKAASIDIEEGTLYPLIRRLEGYGLLVSRWSEDGGRKKRFYKISEEGEELLSDLKREWNSIGESMKNGEKTQGTLSALGSLA